MRNVDMLVSVSKSDDILQWIIDNEPFVIDTYTALEHQKVNNLHLFDVIFHDAIREQHKELFIRLLSIACSSDLGINMEDFLIVMEDENVFDRIVGMCESNVNNTNSNTSNIR